MRYHWGLAVGHVYTHQRPSRHAGVLWPDEKHQEVNVREVPDVQADKPSDQDFCQNNDGHLIADLQADQHAESGDPRSGEDSMGGSESSSRDNSDGEETGEDSDSLEGSDTASDSSSMLLDFEEMYGDAFCDDYED